MKKDQFPSFEEFKREQQDMAAALGRAYNAARIEIAYEEHIKNLTEGELLDPIPATSTTVGGYLEKLEEVFEVNSLKEGELAIFIAPSFYEEWQMRITKEEVWAEQVEKQIWRQFDQRIPIDKTRNRQAVEISPADRSVLAQECTELILNKREREGRRLVLDGIAYYFYLRQDGQLLSAMKHSPQANTRTGELVERIGRWINSKPTTTA
ncbi:MAG: hypothetical protein AAF462_11485 [Thermodesulfobacteriota bacterium]